MVIITLGYDSREKYNWKVLPNDYPETHHNKKLIVKYHAKLWEKVKNIMKYQKKGYDTILNIDGHRRCGKSTLAKSTAYLLNPNLTIHNFVAGIEESAEKIANAKDEDVLIFDEGSLVANSKEGMKKLNIQLEKIVDVIGVKKLILIFCMPSFFGVSRPIAVTHSRFLIHVYTDKRMNRGYFKYWGTKSKRLLYQIGKKNFGSYTKPQHDWNGKFKDFQLPFEEEYNKLKMNSMKEALGIGKKKEKPKTERDYKREFIAKFRENNPEITNKQVAMGFGISESEYYRRMRENKAMKDSKTEPLYYNTPRPRGEDSQHTKEGEVST